jgi:hypothetical protein
MNPFYGMGPAEVMAITVITCALFLRKMVKF